MITLSIRETFLNNETPADALHVLRSLKTSILRVLATSTGIDPNGNRQVLIGRLITNRAMSATVAVLKRKTLYSGLPIIDTILIVDGQDGDISKVIFEKGRTFVPTDLPFDIGSESIAENCLAAVADYGWTLTHVYRNADI